MCEDSVPGFLGAHYFLWVTPWSPRRRGVRTNRLCDEHISTRAPEHLWLCYFTRQQGLCRWRRKIILGYLGGTPTAEGATGGKWDVTLKKNQAHAKQKECGWPLRGELSRWRTASKQTGASVPQLQGINFRQHSNEPGGQFTLRASRKKQKSTVTLILILWDSSRKASPTTMYSDFWSTELWWNKWALFQVAKRVVIYYGSNKKLICSQIRQWKVRQGGTQAERKTQRQAISKQKLNAGKLVK